MTIRVSLLVKPSRHDIVRQSIHIEQSVGETISTDSEYLGQMELREFTRFATDYGVVPGLLRFICFFDFCVSNPFLCAGLICLERFLCLPLLRCKMLPSGAACVVIPS